jgi:pimeloyl-ACP methyl ester carboxylesterase
MFANRFSQNKNILPTIQNQNIESMVVSNIWNFTPFHTENENQYKIYYEEYLNHVDKPNLLLIHGFGASTFHWRYNIPELSKHYNVFAMDLLGFGASDKPVIEYTPEIWRTQTSEFVKKIYQQTNQPVTLIGNSIGGFISVYSAADPEITPLIQSVVLINAVGVFKGKELPFIYPLFSWMLVKPVITTMFYFFKTNIREILLSLYPSHPERVDDALVESIRKPAEELTAGDVFYKVIKGNIASPVVYMDDLLSGLDIPFLVLNGVRDPWIQPHIYGDFIHHARKPEGHLLNAGHCPHDEIPDEVNGLILSFLESSREPSQKSI